MFDEWFPIVGVIHLCVQWNRYQADADTKMNCIWIISIVKNLYSADILGTFSSVRYNLF